MEFNREICCIGHITHDRVVTPGRVEEMPGGTAWYFANAMASLDPDACSLVTRVGPDESAAAGELANRGIAVRKLPSRTSVMFENIYGDNPDYRIQRVGAKADPFECSDTQGICARVWHLGALLADDFPSTMIPNLSKLGLVSVDAQGFLRKVTGCRVEPCAMKEMEELLRNITVLKANEQEMVALTGETDVRHAAKRLGSMGVRESVLTLGSKGSVVHTAVDGAFYTIPAFAVPGTVDATGCGDTYMAGYLWRRLRGDDPGRAGLFAAALCSLKLRGSGPFRSSANDVERLAGSWPGR